jgi:hypothetical protein
MGLPPWTQRLGRRISFAKVTYDLQLMPIYPDDGEQEAVTTLAAARRNLLGPNQIRRAPMPTWVKLAIDAWTSAAAIFGRLCLPLCEYLRSSKGTSLGGEGSLADAEAIRGGRWPSRNRAS